MSKEFIPSICWQEFYTARQDQANALINAGFKGLRIFFNLRDLPRKSESTSWQGYIQYLFNNMPNGQHAWNSLNKTPEPMRATFDFCKKYNWLPIVCMGTSEEEVSGEWIGRVPTDWTWIGRFVREFAIYLKNNYGFSRCDLEVWNEPTKVWGKDYKSYCGASLTMGSNWKTIPNYKLSVFNDDIFRETFLDGMLTNSTLMKITDYIGTHIGVGQEDSEWDDNLIAKTTTKIKAKYPHLEQSVSEMTVNGTWSRLSQLPDNVTIYGLIGAIRNKEAGTATRMDDIWLWGRDGSFEVTSSIKAQILKDFNKTYYKPYEVNIMEQYELNYVKKGTINNETKIVQEILLDSGYVLSVTGKCDDDTVTAIKEFQTAKKIQVDGWVGKGTWEKLILDTPTGTTRFLPLFMQLITKNAVYR